SLQPRSIVTSRNCVVLRPSLRMVSVTELLLGDASKRRMENLWLRAVCPQGAKVDDSGLNEIDMRNLAPDEPVSEFEEFIFGRTGRFVGVSGRSRTCPLESAGHKHSVDIVRRLGVTRHERDPGTHDVGDRAFEERVVGAAEDDSIDLRFNEWLEVVFGR